MSVCAHPCASQDARDAARYRWMRVAFVDFDDDDLFNEALEPLSLCYTPEEVDAAIDAELAKAGASNTLSDEYGTHQIWQRLLRH